MIDPVPDGLVRQRPSADARAGARAAAKPVARERIRVAYVVDNMRIGGTELNAVRTAERLDAGRFELSVICFQKEGPIAARYAAAGIPIEHFPIGSLYAPRTMRQIVRLAGHLREQRVAIVHCHDRYSDFVGVLGARLAGTPAIIASKRWGESLLRHRLTSAVAFHAAHRVLANSAGVVESLRREEHVSERRIALVPNFVDADAFEAPPASWVAAMRRELAIPAGARTIGIVASLRPVKDHPTLLRAIALLASRWPMLRLVVVGEGGSLEDLRRLAAELGLAETVVFAGLRPPTPSVHHLFEISVLCSRSEGFPNAVVEAMAAGRPVVGTDVIGIRDAVRANETGLLVPPADPAALADALDRLLSDPALRLAMGEAGRRRAAEEYHGDRVIATLESLYEEMVERPTRGHR